MLTLALPVQGDETFEAEIEDLWASGSMERIGGSKDRRSLAEIGAAFSQAGEMRCKW